MGGATTSSRDTATMGKAGHRRVCGCHRKDVNLWAGGWAIVVVVVRGLWGGTQLEGVYRW